MQSDKVRVFYGPGIFQPPQPPTPLPLQEAQALTRAQNCSLILDQI